MADNKKKATLQEKCVLLDDSKWARDFEWPDVQTLVKYMDLLTAPKGAIIISEGKRASFLGIIVKGQVEVYKEDLLTKRRGQLAVMRTGEVLGEMSLFDGEPRSASVVALEDTDLLVLTSDQLNLLIKENPPLAIKVLMKLGKYISRRHRMAHGKIME